MFKFLFALLLSLNASLTQATSQAAPWYIQQAGVDVMLNVELFVSSTCEHCQKADLFFSELEQQTPWLLVHRHFINKDKAALKLFYDQLQAQHIINFAVPAVFFCDSRWAGFESAETTGKVLLKALNYCHQRISQQGKLNPATVNVLRQWGNVNQFQIDRKIAQSAVKLITYSALTDAFSPCSLFCFAAFLAFLWLYPNNKGLQISLAAVFLLALGVLHYVQQAHLANYYQRLPLLRIAAALIGLLLLLFTFRYFRKSQSRETIKPNLLAFIVVILTVIAVQTYQQTCVFNAALLFERWIREQSLAPLKQCLYMIAYQVLYLIPYVVLILIWRIVARKQRWVSWQNMFNKAACLILVCIGALLVVYPSLLANLSVSFLVLFASLVIGWFLRFYPAFKS